MEAIRIENLDFSYGKEQVLEKIGFSLPEGRDIRAGCPRI